MDISKIVSTITYYVKNFIEKIKYGSNHSECFSLDYTLTRLILPRLKRYRHYVVEFGTYPDGLESIEHWLSILDEIIQGFEYMLLDDYAYFLIEDCDRKINKSLQLFSEYYQDFWL